MATLTGKVALVTGGSRGIGRAIALRLARDGAAVAVNYASGRPAADEVVAAIEGGGGTAAAIGADVSDRAAIRLLFDQVEARFGGVDIVVTIHVNGGQV